MKKIFLISLLALFTLSPLHSMQSAASKLAERGARHYAKKGFSGIMTSLHWAIAAGSSFGTGAAQAATLLDENKIIQKHNNASKQVTNFIREKIKDHAPNYELHGVKIVYLGGNSRNMGVVGRHHIVITPLTAIEISQALENNNIPKLLP